MSRQGTLKWGHTALSRNWEGGQLGEGWVKQVLILFWLHPKVSGNLGASSANPK